MKLLDSVLTFMFLYDKYEKQTRATVEVIHYYFMKNKILQIFCRLYTQEKPSEVRC